jgi:hypothetical protein
MGVWRMLRETFRFTYVVLLIGLLAGWIAKDHPAPALIGLGCFYAVLALLAGPIGKVLGLPTFRADEAYSDTLRRWRKERRSS